MIAIAPRFIYLDHLIDHDVHRVATRREELYHLLQYLPRSPPVNSGENDKSGMQFNSAKQLSEIPRISGDDDTVLGNTALNYRVIAFTAPSNIQRMDRLMCPRFIQTTRQGWRQALIDE
jgi:hypothetical protein